MKKIFTLILLSLLAVNLNLFSINEEQEQSINAPQKKQLSKKDMIKITAASLGCGLFTAMSISSYYSWCRIIDDEMNLFDYLPGTIALMPLFMIKYPLKILGIEDKNKIIVPLSFILGAGMSGGIAYKCGEYVWKKLASIKKDKPTKA